MSLPKRVTYYVVIYDIFSDAQGRWVSSSERRRAKIARLLLEHGIRTQKSVYELSIFPQNLEKLIGLITKIANENKDKIYIYPIENKLLKGIKRKGREIDILKNIFI